MDSISVRFLFDSFESAVEALLMVLEDARETDKLYAFGSLSARQIMSSGLLLNGDVEHLVAQISELPGANRHDE